MIDFPIRDRLHQLWVRWLSSMIASLIAPSVLGSWSIERQLPQGNGGSSRTGHIGAVRSQDSETPTQGSTCWGLRRQPTVVTEPDEYLQVIGAGTGYMMLYIDLALPTNQAHTTEVMG